MPPSSLRQANFVKVVVFTFVKGVVFTFIGEREQARVSPDRPDGLLGATRPNRTQPDALSI